MRVSKEIAERIRAVLPLLPRGVSVNSFAEDALDQMLVLIQSSPEERQMPKLCVTVDAARKPVEFRVKPYAQTEPERTVIEDKTNSSRESDPKSLAKSGASKGRSESPKL